MSEERFDLPVALVTGSTSGIGRAVAESLAQSGYRLVIHSPQSAEEGRKLAAQLGRGALYFGCDLTEPDSARRLSEFVAEKAGRLDVLVNNAGRSVAIPHDDMSAASSDIWHALYQLNVVAPWELITHCRSMLEARASRDGLSGCVVNISSHAGVRPEGASIPYAASKAALNHVTRLLARTLGPAIRVNAVAPGLVDTPMTHDWPQAQQRWRDTTPMRRSALPADIAQIVASLVASDYLTGEIILADGGLNLGAVGDA